MLLHSAVRFISVEVIQDLIRAYPEGIFVFNNEGKLPVEGIFLSKSEKNNGDILLKKLEMLSEFLKFNSNMFYTDNKDGVSPFDLAVDFDVSMVRKILEFKCDDFLKDAHSTLKCN